MLAFVSFPQEGRGYKGFCQGEKGMKRMLRRVKRRVKGMRKRFMVAFEREARYEVKQWRERQWL